MKDERSINEWVDSINCDYCDAVILDADVSAEHPLHCSPDCAYDAAEKAEHELREELEHIRLEGAMWKFL